MKLRIIPPASKVIIVCLSKMAEMSHVVDKMPPENGALGHMIVIIIIIIIIVVVVNIFFFLIFLLLLFFHSIIQRRI